MKVKFTKAYSTRVGNRTGGQPDPDAEAETFQEGQVVDFAKLRGDPEAGRRSALHFINRGVAVKAKEGEEEASHAPQPQPLAGKTALPPSPPAEPGKTETEPGKTEPGKTAAEPVKHERTGPMGPERKSNR